MGQTERDAALEQAYEGIKNRFSGTKEQFISCFYDWEIVPVIAGGDICGSVFIKDNEIHVSVNNSAKRRWFTREICIKTLDRIIKKYGVAKTRAMKQQKDCCDFIERMGFTMVSEQDGLCLYENREIKYA